jgi:hypothetical protein
LWSRVGTTTRMPHPCNRYRNNRSRSPQAKPKAAAGDIYCHHATHRDRSHHHAVGPGKGQGVSPALSRARPRAQIPSHIARSSRIFNPTHTAHAQLPSRTHHANVVMQIANACSGESGCAKSRANSSSSILPYSSTTRSGCDADCSTSWKLRAEAQLARPVNGSSYV